MKWSSLMWIRESLLRRKLSMTRLLLVTFCVISQKYELVIQLFGYLRIAMIIIVNSLELYPTCLRCMHISTSSHNNEVTL